MMSKTELHVVRPFGSFGPQYEVDAGGLRRYYLAYALALLPAPLIFIKWRFGLPMALLAVAIALALTAVAALCMDVARKGRRI